MGAGASAPDSEVCVAIIRSESKKKICSRTTNRRSRANESEPSQPIRNLLKISLNEVEGCGAQFG